MSLVAASDIRLRSRCRQIGRVSADVRDLLDRLLADMLIHGGVGLAAPQIGDLRRACVVEVGKRLIFMVNPVVIHTGNTMVWSDEGCLSFPSQTVRVPRHERVRIGFTDYHGQKREEMLGGLLSIAAQHEIDHLDGILFHMRAHDSRLFLETAA